jgi:Uma2 family endonuclease
MAAAQQSAFISEQDYLAGEQNSDVKHEYIDGQIYAMSGAHANHNRLSATLMREIGNHLKGKPCQPYASDMKVKVGSKYFYPDAMVDCSDSNGYYTETPIMLVEILSKSTRRMDETTKRVAYMQIPSLLEYVLIEQDFVKIEVMRRSDDWRSVTYLLGDNATFTSIGLTLAVEEIYDRVQNEDIAEWLQQKAQA